MDIQELILKLKNTPQVSEYLDFIQEYSFLPIEKNFIEFSQDAYYAMFNTIVGIRIGDHSPPPFDRAILLETGGGVEHP